MKLLTNLSGPLRIYLQDKILTMLELFHIGPRRTVEVTVYLSPFEKLSSLLHSVKLIWSDKKIIDPILLLRPRIPGRAGNRQVHPRKL